MLLQYSLLTSSVLQCCFTVTAELYLFMFTLVSSLLVSACVFVCIFVCVRFTN